MKPESASEETTWEGRWRNDGHRTTGQRAWCFACQTWCYPHDFCTCCKGEGEAAEYERTVQELRQQGNALKKRVVEAEAKAALADDEWGADEEGYLDTTTRYEGTAVTREWCVVCGGHQDFDNVGRRPFPHRDDCKKVRYDALKASANGEEKNDG